MLDRDIRIDGVYGKPYPDTVQRGFWQEISFQGLLIICAPPNLHQDYVDQLKIFIRWVVVVVLGAVRPRWQSSHVGPVPERTAWIIALRARDLPSAMNVCNP